MLKNVNVNVYSLGLSNATGEQQVFKKARRTLE
jgi:hypothetical protein